MFEVLKDHNRKKQQYLRNNYKKQCLKIDNVKTTNNYETTLNKNTLMRSRTNFRNQHQQNYKIKDKILERQ